MLPLALLLPFLSVFLAADTAPEMSGALPPIPDKFRRVRVGDAAAAWAVADAPYRAAVVVGSVPTIPEAGVVIELPEFGATLPDLADVVLLDKKGDPQPIARFWRAEGKRALVLAKDLDSKQVYYLYFGGGKKRETPSWKPQMFSLLMETRRMAGASQFQNWGEMEAAWQQGGAVDGMGFVPYIHHAVNPYGESHKFLTHYTGYLVTKGLKEITLFTQSSDASFVLVNGQYVLGWPGKHKAEANAKTVPQKTVPSAGPFTRIDYYHAKGEDTNQPAMLLGWVHEKKYVSIPSDAWVHAGAGNITRFEGQEGRPVPVPNVSFNSYIGYNDSWYYETSFWMPSPPPPDWTAEWQFDDGAVRPGALFTRVLVSYAPQKVTLRLKRGQEVLQGFRLFQPPEGVAAASINRAGDTERYAQALGQDDPLNLSLPALRSCAFFLAAYGTLQQGVRVAEAYVKKCADQKDPVWADSQVLRIRSLSQTNPQQALVELRQVPPGSRQLHAAKFDQLEADLLVFCLRDLTAVGRLEQMIGTGKDHNTVQLMRVRLGDLYRLNGKYPDAIEKYRAAQKTVADATAGRKIPAQDEAFSLSVTEAIADGEREEGQKRLEEWELVHPMAKLNSSFLILRAQWLIQVGRWREALAELDSFRGFNPESPYLADADFYRARALWELGNKDEARKAWAEIFRKYPKHPLAAQSDELARQP